MEQPATFSKRQRSTRIGAFTRTCRTEPMNVRSITKLLVVFSAFFCCVLLAGIEALNKGWLSPRTLGTLLALLCVSASVFLAIAFRRLASKRGVQGLEVGTATISPSTRRGLITMYKAWIVVLALCLVGGVLKGASVRPVPVFPMVVGATMNLLITRGLVRAVRRLSKTP